MATELTMVKKFRVEDGALVMASAEELGRIHGRDNDWVPNSLVDAIEELELLGEGCPVDNGYEVISTSIVQN